ncbi:MAG: AAA family ATPase [Syntrophaceae bacterium]
MKWLSVSILKSPGNKILLICATNYIRQLDIAMLRPGRFDSSSHARSTPLFVG